jgi:hypothetical protein
LALLAGQIKNETEKLKGVLDKSKLFAAVSYDVVLIP